MLSHDTKDVGEKLDRRKVVDLLSPEVLNRFSLPSELQVFGPDSVGELAPIALAVERMLVSDGGGRLRLFARADEDWDAAAWSMRHVLLQHASDPVTPVRVRIALMTPIESMDPSAREDLAAWLSAGLLEGVDLTAPTPGIAQPLAEYLGSDGTTRAWAIGEASAAALRPGPNWGVGGVVVRGSIALNAEYAEVNPKQLQAPVSGGNAGHVVICPHEPLPVRRFADWMADEIGKALPSALEKLAQQPRSIEYSDRYFRSPDSPAVLAAFLQMIAKSSDAPIPVNILTAELERSPNNRDFANELARNRAVFDAFRERPDLKVTTSVRNKNALVHSRLLTVRYEDGSSLTLNLDQGVDYWTCDPPLGLNGWIRPKYSKQTTRVTAWVE